MKKISKLNEKFNKKIKQRSDFATLFFCKNEFYSNFSISGVKIGVSLIFLNFRFF